MIDLYAENESWALSLASKIRAPLSIDDKRQAARVALFESIGRFNADHPSGCQFRSFAYQRIRKAIQVETAKSRPLGQSLSEVETPAPDMAMLMVIHTVLRSNGWKQKILRLRAHNYTFSEIAEKLGVSRQCAELRYGKALSWLQTQ